MRKSGKLREKFHFSFKNIKFTIIFLIDRSPFELLIGAVGTQWATVLTMSNGFNITGMADKDFFELRNLLNLNSKKFSEPFSSWTFIKIIESYAPAQCSSYIFQPHDIAKYKLSDNDKKIYFIGWNDHIKDKRNAQNFDKTERLLGKNVADFCRENNISSMWSEIPSEHVSYIPPWSLR